MSGHEDGSIIVTIAIVAHALIIEADLSPEVQGSFQNVRLFSKSGGVGTSLDSFFQSYLPGLNQRFQHSLTEPTINIMEEYSDCLRPQYQEDIKRYNFTSSLFNRQSEKMPCDSVCQLFDNVTFDKVISNQSPTIVSRLLKQLFPTDGVFVISVHKQVSSNNLQLVYPLSGMKRNLNLYDLSDFQEFANLFRSKIQLPIEEMSRLSSNLHAIVKRCADNTEQTREQIKQNTREQISRWKLTLSRDETFIIEIRLSYLLQLIKYVVGNECKINIFDYSCSNTSRFFSVSDRQALKYIDSGDIENPPDRSWGGFSKKMRKTMKKKYRKNKNKKSNRRKSIKKIYRRI
jgi:hypothetical protein